MLGTRLVSGILMAAALVGVLFLDEYAAPWFPLWLLVALVVSVLGASEFVGLLQATPTKPSRNIVIGGVVALVLANWAPHISVYLQRLPQLEGRGAHDLLLPLYALSWPMMTFVGVLMASFIAQSLQYERPGATTSTLAGTTLALAYVGLLGTFVIQLRWLEGTYHGVFPVACLFATAKGADTGAYTVGRIAGRHKLWPILSPNKTIEGAIGGLVFGVLFNCTVVAVARYLLHVPSLSWPETLVFGLVVAVFAQLGDLMESMIKRDCERKDASDAVPGFGGILDVIDSALFAGPIAFGLWIVLGA
ncbi:MAG: phosphatidate cytidylyltransferase [Isosphaeraceae bacterium]